MLLNRITDLDLLSKPFQEDEQDANNDIGSEAELQLLEEIFGPRESAKDNADQQKAIASLSRNQDIAKFISIFQKGKINPLDEIENQQASQSKQM